MQRQIEYQIPSKQSTVCTELFQVLFHRARHWQALGAAIGGELELELGGSCCLGAGTWFLWPSRALLLAAPPITCCIRGTRGGERNISLLEVIYFSTNNANLKVAFILFPKLYHSRKHLFPCERMCACTWNSISFALTALARACPALFPNTKIMNRWKNRPHSRP